MANLTPFPKFRTFLPNSKLYSYEPGTLVPKATFTDASATGANPNPTIADANGDMDVWLNGAYRFILHDANDVQQWDIDNINAQAFFAGVDATVATVTNNGTPQDVMTVNVGAGEMSPGAVLYFDYNGRINVISDTKWAIAIAGTEVLLIDQSLSTTGDQFWVLTGSLYMRDTNNALLHASLLYNTNGPGNPSAWMQHVTANLDLSAAFAFTLRIAALSGSNHKDAGSVYIVKQN